MKEIWVDIKDFEGLYQVSNYGRAKSLNYKHTGREKILKLTKLKSGHLCVNLGRTNLKLIHILVAEHFIPNPDNKPIVHHVDHNPENNRVDNLVWLTQEEHKAEHPEVFEASAKVLSKPINQYDISGNFIKRWKSSMQVQRELGYSNGNINNCLRGRLNTYKGCIWKYAEDC